MFACAAPYGLLVALLGLLIGLSNLEGRKGIVAGITAGIITKSAKSRYC
jgi:hypothetical protein